MSMKTLLVIDVNSRGSLIPGRGGQTAARETALQTVLPWIVERVSQSKRLNSIVVLMNSSDARAMATRVPSVATVIASDESNGLSRLLLAADAFDAEAIIKVDFETPLIDPTLIDMLMESIKQDPSADYVSYREGNEPAKQTAGKFAEWCRVSALREADDFVPGRGESPTSVIHSNPDRFEVRYLKLTASEDRSNLRVRMDSPQDLRNVKDFIA
ncbi:MAG: hypothetical protein AAF497_12355, partial [Planctomycetota bacterium]